jgi:hypothetical protein
MHEITRETAIKVRDIVDAGLVRGAGVPEPGKMCVEAAVCYALGLPHGDDPGCVSAAVRSLKITLNDCSWSSTQARAKGLRRLAVAQLGSAGVVDDCEFARRVVEVAIRGAVARALRAVASVQKDEKHRQALLDAAVRCETEGTLAAARAAADAADAAYAAAHAARAADAAYAAARAARAADAACGAARAADAAYAAAYAAAYGGVAADAARDGELARFAEEVVQVLVAMGAPGCQWLDIVPVDG